jgi:serine/threonine protein kinase
MTECPTIQNYLVCVRQSKLCEPPVLDAYLDKLRSLNATPSDSVGFARRLVADGLLTKYQAEQLLMGRWNNFVIQGKYKILERLSAGSMSDVFICEHILMKRVVALKVLPAEQSGDPASVARFHREARASAKLKHQNVVTVFDVDSAGKHHFLVAEYIDGSDLERVVKVSGLMPFARAANYIRQAAEGLQHAHEMGMVHRDIKPGNLLLDRRGTVKLLDLGLARLFQDETDGLTRMADGHLMLGTLDYLAPEQAIDSHSVDIRADIYGLGATFYFLLAGEALFAGSSKAQKFVQHKVFSVGPIIRGVPGLPERLALVVEKMLAKNPADRYQTPAEVAHALEPWTTVPVSVPSIQEMPKLSPRTRRSLKEMGSGSDVSNTSAVLVSRSSTTPMPYRMRATLDRAKVLKRSVSSYKYLVGGGVAALIALFLLVRSFTGSPAVAATKMDVAADTPATLAPGNGTLPATPAPDQVVMTVEEAIGLARAGRTSEAAPAMRRLLMANPNSADFQWMQLVILDLTNADNASYRSDAEEMFKRFAPTQDRWAHERLAKACLLNPEPIELAQISALAESASAAGGQDKYGEWAMFSYGLALYRSGRFDEAVRQLVETRDKSATEHNETNECLCQLVLAMAHARLKHKAQARTEFDKGTLLMHSGDLTNSQFDSSWHDALSTKLLRREAEALLKSSTR